MKQREFFLGGRLIGGFSKTLVVAEIGINHDGNLDQALKLVDAAAAGGADAVKFQTFRADRLMVPSESRFSQQTDGGESAYQMFRRLELSWESHEKLKAHADERGVLFLSTPFDEDSADFLESLGVPAFKIASSDLTHLPLLRHLARKGKPLILSTGMSYLHEVEEAVCTLQSCGAPDIVLLHCVSTYPAPAEALNLKTIEVLRDRFQLPVGFSDHSEGVFFSLLAAALGAKVLEKHFTLDKNAPGPDHKVSVDPAELRELVTRLSVVDASLGTGCKQPTEMEEQSRRLSRRSIVAAVDIAPEETIQPWMLDCKRPAGGMDPREIDRVIGMQARRRIDKNSIMRWDDVLPAPRPEQIHPPECTPRIPEPHSSTSQIQLERSTCAKSTY
jgi:N,N'-diacetyllegionaminate synthase